MTGALTDRRSDPGRAAARTVALQVGGAAALLVLLVVLASAILFDRAQAREVTDSLRAAATTADDAGDPPTGVWVLLDRAGRTESTPGMPPDVLQASTRLVRSASVDGAATLTTRTGDWPAWRATRDGGGIVAVYDESRHSAEEVRLLRSVTLAGVGGIALAVVVGLLAGRRAVRPLSTALRLQDEFVADASHELRTPLAVVSTRAQLLRRRLPSDVPDSVRREADLLVADTRALGEVVSELLRAAQLEHVPELASLTDVRGLAAEVVASMEPYAQERGVSLTLTRADDTQILTVDAVPSSLRRALVALVDNAIAHSPSGSDVSLRAGVQDTTVRLEVVDHGEGVDPGEVDALTHRYRRGTRAGSGSHERVGLGLALVRQVVRSHHGELEVRPTPGGGATFSLVLPQSEDPSGRG